MRIAINGAGIAGPTLAYWLTGAGHQVLLVEEAPRLRRGGYVVDFWGVGYDIAEKMGLLPAIRSRGYQVREVRFVDRHGHRVGGFDTRVFGRLTHGRFTTVRRSDLSALIYDCLRGRVETMFDDSIAAVEEHAAGVRVCFNSAAPRDVDLVIGADGLHSKVRGLVFGPESEFEVPLGYHVAAFEVTGYRPRDELVYVSHAVPGRQVSRFAMRDDKTLFLFVFRDEYLPTNVPARRCDPKTVLTKVFVEVGWECPEILRAMTDVTDVYFDRVSQIRMKHWFKGRTALLGDAAACVSLLAGEGTGLAIAEAYVLAHALRACEDHITNACVRYEHCLMPLLRQKQASAFKLASSFVPKTALGLSFRNAVTHLLGVPMFANYFIGRDLRDDFNPTACGF